ncbi:hypothetical protein NEIPOLOT_01306 [Neisseria polysaccharea ATCC 43768]|nr:hypothetical protein NEIPOLOT_01306 [Neisseria polysaccharea ATCC 43768]
MYCLRLRRLVLIFVNPLYFPHPKNEERQEFIGKTAPFCRHSRESGNLEMKSNRNLSEMAETERTGFPPARE